MTDRPQIQPQMEVYASDGTFVGRVETVDGRAIRLTAKDSPDLHDLTIPLERVARVDRHVHLNVLRDGTGGAAAPGTAPVVGAAGAAIGAVGLGAAGHIESPGGAAAARPAIPPAPPSPPRPNAAPVPPAPTAGAAVLGAAGDAAATPLPPIRNPAVPGAKPRGNYYLPWVLGLIGGLLLLFVLLRSCDTDEGAEVTQTGSAGTAAGTAQRDARPAPVVTDLTTGTIAYDLNAYLASGAAGERSFAFDRLNFRTGSARLRREDQEDLDDIARVLAAYPTARIAVVGYTDARGDSRSNARLGGDRANAVVGGLAERGVAPARMEARSGGEADPIGTNAQEGGRAENRRTELIVLAR